MKKKASFLLVALTLAFGSFFALNVSDQNSKNDALFAMDASHGISHEKSNSPQKVPDPGY
ncbi:hypothetical protein AAFJ72_11915 [Brevibacillus gelatini]|uniref:hypothetical protein n=1 Tax=Brevibacillus gelatini TaxID=1655277 RepID=UPI003D81C366